MPTQHKNIKDAILTAVKHTDVSTVVSSYYTLTNWALNNVVSSGRPLIHEMNRGRKVVLNVYRNETSFENLSDAGAGTLNNKWILELFLFAKPTGTTLFRDEENYEEAAYDIIRACMKKIRANGNLTVSANNPESLQVQELVPFGYMFTYEFITSNSYVNDTI